jgi:hypothetical protein
MAGLAVVGFASHANAETYDFTRITNNAPDNVASQLQVEVTDSGDGGVLFKFTNTAAIASSITDVYFDDGTLLAIATITGSSGVAFEDPATPADLPGGNTIGFVTTQDFSADANNPSVANGVNSSTEWLTIKFTLQGTQTFQDTIDSLADGSLRIGLHVQGIASGNDQSDGFVNNPPGDTPEPQEGVAPLPGTSAAAVTLLGILAAKRRRKSAVVA